MLQRLSQSELRIARNPCYADLFFRNRSDIDFSMPAPMQFHTIRPRSDAVVLSKGVAAIFFAEPVELCPPPHPRSAPVRANNPLGAYLPASQVNPIRSNARDDCAPQTLDSKIGGALGHDLVQNGSPYSPPSGSTRKGCIDRQTRAQKANAAKRIR